MVWGIVVLFFLITVVLVSGKGAFLIAGYNTSSKAAQSQYDKKKLSRVAGGGMGAITAVMVLLACSGDSPPDWVLTALPVVIITVTIVMLILCNTICKVKDPAAPQESASESKRNRRIITGALMFTAVVFLFVGFMLSTGEVTATIDGDTLKIDGSYWEDYSVPLNNIKAVSLETALEMGKRTNGLGSFKLLEGHFRNEAFGDYVLYAYVSCEAYVVLDTTEGTVVINAETVKETETLYETLKSAADPVK